MINNIKHISAVIIAVLLLVSCENEINKGPEIDESKLNQTEVNIHRYGKALFELDTNNFLAEVKDIHSEFTLFLGDDIDNPTTLAPLYEYITDTQLISISKKTFEVYPELTKLENQLAKSFARYQYFFPDFEIPEVYTYISNLYYEKPVILDNSILIIALDVYLGGDYIYYRSLGLPYYITRRMSSEYIAIDAMKEIYNSYLYKPYKQKTLVDKMVNSGKILYYLDAVLPETPDSLKIGYTEKQINWINANKKNIWAFLVNNNMFYSPDFKVQSNFMKEAPFTSGFSNESPPRIGHWLGWQIVRKYMNQNPDISLKELIKEKDFQKIFNESGYKP